MQTEELIKIVFLSDTHLGYDYPVRPRIKRRRRGDDFFNNFKAALEFAKRVSANAVIHGGDLFFRTRIPKLIVQRVYELLLEFSESGIPIFIVPGNHESSRLPDRSILNRSGIHVFDAPETFILETDGILTAIAGFPFVRGNIRDTFPLLYSQTGLEDSTADIKILCLHQAVEGSKVGPSDFTFKQGEEVIQGEDLPLGLSAILCGHIHQRQILDFPAKNEKAHRSVIFCGSIERTSFAEKDEEKGFYLLGFPMEGNDVRSLRRLSFIPLQTRAMIDFALDGLSLTPENLKTRLTDCFSALDPDAVVRLNHQDPVPEWITKQLTASFLREAAPRSMNIQLSTKFYPERQRRRLKTETLS